VVRCAKQCIASYRKSCIELLDYKSLDETIDDAKPIYLCQIPMHEFWKNLDDVSVSASYVPRIADHIVPLA